MRMSAKRILEDKGLHERRPFWDISCFVGDKRDRRFLWAGIIVSLSLHFGYIGNATYHAYQTVKSWKSLLTVRVVERPAATQRRSTVEIIELRNPLYYPPGLIRSPSPASPVRSERQVPKKSVPEAEPVTRSDAGTTDAANGPSQAETSQVQDDTQLLRQGLEQARTINIAPIKEQIIRIYRAQQAGEISLKQVTVAVNFKVREDGAFTNVRLTQSSGIPEVDNAALFIIDEVNKLRALVAFRSTESATLRLTIGESVEFSATALSPSMSDAEQIVREMNGLLFAARLLAVNKDARAANLLANLRIAQEGTKVVASIKIPRAEATEMFKSAIKLGS